MVSNTGVRCRAASTLSQWFMFTAHPGVLKPRGLRTACWKRAGRQKLAKNLPGTSLPSLRRCVSAQDLILCLCSQPRVLLTPLASWLGLGPAPCLGQVWWPQVPWLSLVMVPTPHHCPRWGDGPLLLLVQPASLSLWSCLLSCCLISVLKTDLVLYAQKQLGVNFLFMAVKDMTN